MRRGPFLAHLVFSNENACLCLFFFSWQQFSFSFPSLFCLVSRLFSLLLLWRCLFRFFFVASFVASYTFFLFVSLSHLKISIPLFSIFFFVQSTNSRMPSSFWFLKFLVIIVCPASDKRYLCVWPILPYRSSWQRWVYGHHLILSAHNLSVGPRVRMLRSIQISHKKLRIWYCKSVFSCTETRKTRFNQWIGPRKQCSVERCLSDHRWSAGANWLPAWSQHGQWDIVPTAGDLNERI